MSRSPLPNVRVSSLFLFLLLLTFSSACQTQALPDTRAADEAALRKLDDEWSKAAGSKDVEKTISYYSDDAVVMPPNSPALTGKEPIRGLWKAMLGAPGFAGGWKSTKVEVARLGDLAYVSGNYELSEHDASGKPMTDKGKYLEVWKKQADGSWKCVVDMFNTDLPAAVAPAEKKDVKVSK
jgi:ketosteroid isomerase-like protein